MPIPLIDRVSGTLAAVLHVFDFVEAGAGDAEHLYRGSGPWYEGGGGVVGTVIMTA